MAMATLQKQRIINKIVEGNDGADHNNKFTVLCPVTFPVKASLAARTDPAIWEKLLQHSPLFTLTIWQDIIIEFFTFRLKIYSNLLDQSHSFLWMTLHMLQK